MEITDKIEWVAAAKIKAAALIKKIKDTDHSYYECDAKKIALVCVEYIIPNVHFSDRTMWEFVKQEIQNYEEPEN
jgi:hypothetical protein